jgi:hypothetical protein
LFTSAVIGATTYAEVLDAAFSPANMLSNAIASWFFRRSCPRTE